jgi:hypothetical protein
MQRRSYVVSALVLGSVLMAADARADFAVPATAGMPGYYADVNTPTATYWFWYSDVFIWRTVKPTTDQLEWMIPLVFYGLAGHRYKWGATVMVSGGTSCNIRWWPDDVPGTGPIGTTATSRADDGPLELTTPDLCSDASGCITSYATAQVSCWVGGGGFVGPVNYWLVDMDAPAASN